MANKQELRTGISMAKFNFDNVSKDLFLQLEEIHQCALEANVTLNNQWRSGGFRDKEDLKATQLAEKELDKITEILKKIYVDVMGQKTAVEHMSKMSTIYFE